MAAQFANGFALLIGVDENQVADWALPQVRHDITLLENALTDVARCAYPAEQVRVISGAAATRQGILAGLAWLQSHLPPDGDATVLVYFGGRGWRTDANDAPDYYLIPADVDENGIVLSALRARDFANALAKLNAQRLFVIFDCYHGVGAHGKDAAGVASGFQAWAAAPQWLFEENDRPTAHEVAALAVLPVDSGCAALSSSQDQQHAYRNQDGDSIFVSHLVAALSGQAQYPPTAKEIQLSQVLDFVQTETARSAEREWNARQEPIFQASGNFPIGLLLGGAGLKQPSTAQQTEIDTGGGAYVAGNVDTGGGDFVGQDKITVGNVVNSIGVAIGRGAQATVNIFRDTSALRQQQDRQAMLSMVQEFWVQGVLEKAQAGAPLIQIRLVELAEAVNNQPWATVMQEAAGITPALPDQAEITGVFYGLNALNRALLVLGAPGSGKTTQLLVLARDAIRRAQKELAEPIPVVFNLASWALKRQPLDEWLVAEFNDKYLVPAKVSRPWIENDELLLLLDGLDEVQTAFQDDCVAAINAFHRQHRMAMVVCCRADEYAALPVRLDFQRAVHLQSLSPQQIETWLNATGDDDLAALGAALRQDEPLRELAQTPLMLNTMMRTFQGLSLAQMQGLAAKGERQRFLFDAYVQRMFQHGPPAQMFTQAQTVHWLAWLAQQMRRQSQALFLIERVQPGWLPTRSQRWLYIFISRVAISLLGGLLGGLTLGLGFGFFFGAYYNALGEGLIRGLVEGLLSCLIAGFVAGLIDVVRMALNQRGIMVLRSVNYGRLAFNIVIESILVGVGVWLGLWLILGSIEWLGFPIDFWFVEGISVGLLVGLCFGLIFGYGYRNDRQLLRDDILTVEFLRWSPRDALVGGIYGLVGGLFSGLILGLGTQFVPLTYIFSGLRLLLISVPVLGLLGLIFGGIRGGIVQTPNQPNQGIWLSAKNALFIGGGIGVGMGIVGVVIGWLLGLRLLGVLTLGVYGLFFGILAALWYGGLDVLKHGVVRWLLYRGGHAPLNYARFLNFAAERILLRKVGGGYIFIHRLLLDYFAGTNEE